MPYMKRSYDHYCERCGKDISQSAQHTKYCLECSKELNSERARTKKAYCDLLIRRDTVANCVEGFWKSSTVTGVNRKYYKCPECRGILNKNDMFCRYCGKRLLNDDQKGEDANG